MTIHQPSVITFCGHMIDRPDRTNPRFPAYLETAVGHEMYKIIARTAPAAAITSAACGGDLIFAEAILQQGIPLIVVLPFQDREDFIQRSVNYAGQHWVARFEQVCAQATAIVHSTSGGYRSDYDFEKCQHTILSLGRYVAAVHGMLLRGLVLCDFMQLGTQIGGTNAFLKFCQNQAIPYDTIDLANLRNRLYGNVIAGNVMPTYQSVNSGMLQLAMC